MAKAYRNVLSNPREAKTVFRLQNTFIKSESRRKAVAKECGVEVPPFLICRSRIAYIALRFVDF